MSLRTVAEREARGLWDARTVRWGLFLAAGAFLAGGYVIPTSVPEPTVEDYAGFMRPVATLLVPLLGLLLGYRAVVADRAAGRLALVLSLPNSRQDVVLGKYLGRAGVLAGTLAAGTLVAAALVAYPFGSVSVPALLGYLGLTALYGVAFLSIGFALSTFTGSPRLATAGAFAVFFVLVVAWSQLPPVLYLGLDYLGLADGGLPDWALFAHGATPGMAYRRLLDAFAGVASGSYLGPGAPWYLGAPPALGVLAVWVVVPLLAGYRRFEGADL